MVVLRQAAPLVPRRALVKFVMPARLPIEPLSLKTAAIFLANHPQAVFQPNDHCLIAFIDQRVMEIPNSAAIGRALLRAGERNFSVWKGITQSQAENLLLKLMQE